MLRGSSSPSLLRWPARVWRSAEAILRSSGSARELLSLRTLLATTLVFGMAYGATMGTYAGLAPHRWLQIVYSALKVPLLLLVSFALSVPSFYVLNAMFGLASDFRAALRGLAAAQSGMTILLASLAPLTAFWYASVPDYASAITFNGIMFAVASVSAQVVLRRHYSPLISKNPRHRWMLGVWWTVYAFVAIQFAWILRPFIGDPRRPPEFFRDDPFSSNAYLFVLKLAWSFIV